MITDKDVKRIVDANIEASKEIFVTKDEFEELRQDFRNLQSSVDGYAKKLILILKKCF